MTWVCPLDLLRVLGVSPGRPVLCAAQPGPDSVLAGKRPGGKGQHGHCEGQVAAVSFGFFLCNLILTDSAPWLRF